MKKHYRVLSLPQPALAVQGEQASGHNNRRA